MPTGCQSQKVICQAIELCGAFGNLGVAKVAEAVGNKASVGVVRFDCGPLLGFKSGDALAKE